MVFAVATNNQKKLKEIQRILDSFGVTAKTLKELDIAVEIEENGTTFEENAVIKAKTIAEIINRGYGDKILLSHDYSAFIDFGKTDFETWKNCGSDFTTIHKKLFPALKKLGVQDAEIRKHTVENPKKVLEG